MVRVVETMVSRVNGTKQAYTPLWSGVGLLRVSVEVLVVKVARTVTVVL